VPSPVDFSNRMSHVPPPLQYAQTELPCNFLNQFSVPDIDPGIVHDEFSRGPCSSHLGHTIADNCRRIFRGYSIYSPQDALGPPGNDSLPALKVLDAPKITDGTIPAYSEPRVYQQSSIQTYESSTSVGPELPTNSDDIFQTTKAAEMRPGFVPASTTLSLTSTTSFSIPTIPGMVEDAFLPQQHSHP
jgi:hypothetical protein